MQKFSFFVHGSGPVQTAIAQSLLAGGGEPAPCPQASLVVLGVPSLLPDGSLRFGGRLEALLEEARKDALWVGGRLEIPGRQVLDLLKDEAYLAQNAGITAHCALRLGLTLLPRTLEGCPVAVLGWGRIGKCLSQLLRALGAEVTVCARKEADRAQLRALGYAVCAPEDLSPERFRLLYNTAPAPVLDLFPPDCVIVDLASAPGLGKPELLASGLPAKLAPESSGSLIAQKILERMGSQ